VNTKEIRFFQKIGFLLIYQGLHDVLANKRQYGLFLGDCKEILDEFPDKCIDCVITSPPYWQMRDYSIEVEQTAVLIGNEETPEEYVNLMALDIENF